MKIFIWIGKNEYWIAKRTLDSFRILKIQYVEKEMTPVNDKSNHRHQSLFFLFLLTRLRSCLYFLSWWFLSSWFLTHNNSYPAIFVYVEIFHFGDDLAICANQLPIVVVIIFPIVIIVVAGIPYIFIIEAHWNHLMTVPTTERVKVV